MADLTIREKFFDDLAKGARWDVGVSIARGNPLPLDANSVFESYADLETYAAGVLAYPGQVVAVVNAESTGIYYLDQNKTIKPVGVIPAGDSVSVDMDENDVISLHDFGKAFYKYIPAQGDVAAHYEKVEVSEENPWAAGLEPKVSAEGLGWYEPNPTTVDGVNSQVTALANRMATAESDIDAIESAVEAIEADYLKAADKTELADAIAAEAERADAAEKANAAAIKAIADDYLKGEDKYDDTALAARVKAIEDDYLVEADKYDDTALSGRVATIEGDYLKAADIAEMATKSDVAAEAKAREDANKDLQDQINLIMNNPDTENVIDSINEFMQYIEDHGDIAEGFRTDIGANSDAIATEVERATNAENALSGRLDTLEAIDHEAYINADVALKSELEGKIATKADQSALETAISELEEADGALEDRVADVEAALAADGSVAQAIAAAEGRAAEDATTKAAAAQAAAIADAAGKYATTGALSDLEADVDGRLEALEAFDHATYATKDELKTTDDKAVSNTGLIENLTSRLDGIVAQGGEPNTINTVKVNGVALTIDDQKAVDIDVPTHFSDLTDDSGFDARITAAKTQADKGVDDAAAAKAVADANKATLDNHGPRITALETAKGDHETRIANLEADDIKHAAEYESLSGIVTSHTEAIAKKAEKTEVDTVLAKASANESAIKTLNETTIPGIQEIIGTKADVSALNNYYTKTEIGTIAENKTIVQMIADAQAAAAYDDTAVKALISAEESRAKLAEQANAEEIARVNGVLVKALDNNTEGLDSIKELANWINTHGTEASSMASAIEENTTAIAAINNAETGILATAKAYTNTQIAGIPAATAEALGLVKVDNVSIKMNENNQLYVAKVSTDILEQGNNILVLNGGSAKE